MMGDTSAGAVKISLKVIPNASRNEIAGCAAGVWRIKIAAPADKGKANRELLEFLGERLRIKKNNLSIIRGHTSHSKLLSVEGLAIEEIIRRLLSG